MSRIVLSSPYDLSLVTDSGSNLSVQLHYQITFFLVKCIIKTQKKKKKNLSMEGKAENVAASAVSAILCRRGNLYITHIFPFGALLIKPLRINFTIYTFRTG